MLPASRKRGLEFYNLLLSSPLLDAFEPCPLLDAIPYGMLPASPRRGLEFHNLLLSIVPWTLLSLVPRWTLLCLVPWWTMAWSLGLCRWTTWFLAWGSGCGCVACVGVLAKCVGVLAKCAGVVWWVWVWVCWLSVWACWVWGLGWVGVGCAWRTLGLD